METRKLNLEELEKIQGAGPYSLKCFGIAAIAIFGLWTRKGREFWGSVLV